MSEKISPDRPRCKGVVATFLSRKGYGFITGEEGEKLFVHFSDIRGHGFRTLEAGEEVEYTRAMGDRGAQATDVVRLNPPVGEHFDDEPPTPTRTW